MQFTTKNEGKWFWFDENNESEGGVLLRPLTVGEANKINKLCSKKEKKFTKKNVYQWSDINEEQYNKLVYDYCIVDWKNVVIEDGKEIECNQENKMLLMNNSMDFVNFILKHLESLNSEVLADVEDKEGN